MSVQKLPSGRWRAQVYDPDATATCRACKGAGDACERCGGSGTIRGQNVSVSKVVPGEPGTYRTKTEAKDARTLARGRLGAPRGGVTVAVFRDRWLHDPLFARPKQSTTIHNRERTKAFAEKYGAVPLRDVGDEVVGEWLAGGKRAGTVPALRAMWNDAASAKAGRLVQRNPWAGLGISRGPGNRHKAPPAEDVVWQLVEHARRLSGPYFAAWLQVAAFTGMRPGELDALLWSRVDFDTGRVRVAEQINAATGTVTTPKNGQARDALLTPPAREALVALPRAGEHVFVNLRGGHLTAPARAYHWKAVRAAAGVDLSLYMCTRHFAGHYMTNVLELPSEDVAVALGHTDGGDLVRRLYGHRDRALALGRVQAAYERTAGGVTHLRVVREGAG